MIKHPLLRYFGGKFRLAHWIISYFPKHDIYVEPFGGAASVLLQKPRIGNEVYNDLSNDVVNLFKVLRDPILSKQLINSVALTPFHRTEYFDACNITTSDPVELARCMLIRSFMSFSSTGCIKGCSGFSGSTKKGKTNDATVWAKIPNNLAFICQRLAGVIIENLPALELLQKHDSTTTLFYLDPPYVSETRTSTNVYQYEMEIDDHEQLLISANSLSGSVVISGYDCDLYNDYLSVWQKQTSPSRAAGQKGQIIRNECIWIKNSNY